MTIRFCPARLPYSTPVSRALSTPEFTPAANDNSELDAASRDEILRAALKLFAKNGFAAARAARHQAQQAFFAGDRESYNWWLAVCQTLDKRMALQERSRNNRAAKPPILAKPA